MKSLRSFARWLSTRGLSQNTVKSYVQSAKLYSNRYPTLSEANLLKWKDQMAATYKPKTIAIRINGINAYLTFSKETYRLKNVKLPRVHHLEKVISLSDYSRLMKGLARKAEDDLLYQKWMLLVKFMAMTGARVSEVLQVQAEHIGENKVPVLAKGAVYRTILIPTRLCREISTYLEKIRQDDGYVFGKTKDKPYSIGTVEARLKKFAKEFRIPREVMHPHAFRHLFGKNFMQSKGADITVLADLLGHASIETTRIYTRRSQEEQQQALDKIVTW